MYTLLGMMTTKALQVTLVQCQNIYLAPAYNSPHQPKQNTQAHVQASLLPRIEGGAPDLWVRGQSNHTYFRPRRWLLGNFANLAVPHGHSGTWRQQNGDAVGPQQTVSGLPWSERSADEVTKTYNQLKLFAEDKKELPS